MVVISVYTYGVKIIKKFRWESGFLWGGFHGTPPLCTNGSAGYLMQLSVKIETNFRLDWIKSTSLTDKNPTNFPQIVFD